MRAREKVLLIILSQEKLLYTKKVASATFFGVIAQDPSTVGLPLRFSQYAECDC